LKPARQRRCGQETAWRVPRAGRYQSYCLERLRTGSGDNFIVVMELDPAPEIGALPADRSPSCSGPTDRNHKMRIEARSAGLSGDWQRVSERMVMKSHDVLRTKKADERGRPPSPTRMSRGARRPQASALRSDPSGSGLDPVCAPRGDDKVGDGGRVLRRGLEHRVVWSEKQTQERGA
jgi:hypothetical protein